MKIAVVGTGYVGLVQGACLSHLGHDVVCVDILKGRVDALNRGEIPIHEEGLPQLVEAGFENGRLTFTTSVEEAAAERPAVVFVCVQTPMGDDGACDLSYIQTVLQTWGPLLNPSTLIVIKSTVPPGTREEMHAWIGNDQIQIASNPEFLRQGTSVQDFLQPDRILIGVESPAAEQVLRKVHEGIDAPIISTTVETAQLTKYAANAMLATRLSFMNEVAKIADAVDADIKMVEHVVGLDPRIGPKFLRTSAGFGGGCLPKDTLALHHTGLVQGTDPKVFKAVIDANDDQPDWFVKNVLDRLGDVTGKRLAVWGLSFNNGTDDVRHSPAMTILGQLRDRGANIVAYDPHAMPKARRMVGDLIEFADSAIDAAEGADALLALTEWDEFTTMAWPAVKAALRNPLIFDGKHFLPHKELKSHGFEVIGIGLR